VKKVWQYIHLTKKIFLIDCPGIVYTEEGMDDQEIVLKGVVRAEKLEDPEYYIHGILRTAKKQDLERKYDIGDWKDAEEFLSLVAKKKGKLMKV